MIQRFVAQRMTPDLSPEPKEQRISNYELNGLSQHANQDQDDGKGSRLFVWGMKKRLQLEMVSLKLTPD
jgi:hypothetical protein